MNYSELLQLAKGWGNFISSRIIIWWLLNKSYQRLQGEDYITDPKTEKSNRTVSIPDFLCEELEEYIAMLYGFKSDDRMFQITKSYLHHEMERGAKIAGVQRIRIHDIRHPYVKHTTKNIILKSRKPKLSEN